MSDGDSHPTLEEDEWLARFILNRRHLRADGTVRREAFVPYKWVELSVTRHLDWDHEKIWKVGNNVATQTGRTLQGRADVQVSTFSRQRLRVVAAPEASNPNHANVLCWPNDKQAQMEIALEIAREARVVENSG